MDVLRKPRIIYSSAAVSCNYDSKKDRWVITTVARRSLSDVYPVEVDFPRDFKCKNRSEAEKRAISIANEFLDRGTARECLVWINEEYLTKLARYNDSFRSRPFSMLDT